MYFPCATYISQSALFINRFISEGSGNIEIKFNYFELPSAWQ